LKRVEEVAQRRLATNEMRCALPSSRDSPIVREEIRRRHGLHRHLTEGENASALCESFT
jgi:hypothetical protein